MTLDQIGIVGTGAVRCRVDVERRNPLKLPDELRHYDRFEVIGPCQLLTTLDVGPLEDRAGIGDKVIYEVTEGLVELPLGHLIFDLALHATGRVLGLFLQLDHYLIVDGFHPGAESFRVDLCAHGDVLHGFHADQVNDAHLDLWRKHRLLRGLQRERTVLHVKHDVLDPRLSRTALHVGEHHKNVGATGTGNLCRTVWVIDTPTLTLTLEQTLSDDLLGELRSIPRLMDVRGQFGLGSDVLGF